MPKRSCNTSNSHVEIFELKEQRSKIIGNITEIKNKLQNENIKMLKC